MGATGVTHAAQLIAYASWKNSASARVFRAEPLVSARLHPHHWATGSETAPEAKGPAGRAGAGLR